MVIRPERNNAQFQPLTIILRNIIKEYPAGGGVLRELCQNADDAGATEIHFVLDRRQHPTQDILHEGLAEFQGASLLSFNNSIFTKVDFESLSRIGDSAKAKDPNSTGKFGRGFNSVYNWTDSPSILSGSSLLILDPHQTWSPEVGQPGGPVYNFVENSQEEEMRNQLAAFSSITEDFDSEFHGTIIRIPLRTESQAAKTNILPPEKLKPTTDTEIIDSFRRFTEEMVETLLFLKNLHTITLRVDNNIYSKAVSATHSFSGAGVASDFEKAKISAAYKQVFVEQSDEPCSINSVMDISLYRGHIEQKNEGGSDRNFKFAISHHFRQGPKDSTLETWSRSQKLFPWTAIATPLEGYEEFKGRLFTTLPLPIYTQHPVHIHGMFSITPDRRNIHYGGDFAVSEDSETSLGTKWNEWLLHECTPNTWIQNLEFVRVLTERSECQFSGWNFWPAGSERESREPWAGILGDVFGRVVARNLGLFPTICGTVKEPIDILFTLDFYENLMSALQLAGVPIVIPPQDRRYELERLNPYVIGLRPLDPSTAREYLSRLKDLPAFENLEFNPRVTLLDYVLSEGTLAEIGSCTAPLIPMIDGTYESFDLPRPHSGSVFLTRDDGEDRLFKKYKRMVDTSRIPYETIKRMRKHISSSQLQKFTKISTWEQEDAARYCIKYIFNQVDTWDADTIHNDNLVDFINQLWGWISRHCTPLASIAQSRIKELFILPLMNGEYRRLDSTIPILDVSKHSGIGGFLRSIAISHLQQYGRRYHIFLGDGFLPVVGESLRMSGYLNDYEDIVSLMTWLVANREDFVDQLGDGEKILLLQHLSALSRSGLSEVQRKSMGDAVACLSIFQEAIPGEVEKRPWISMENRSISYVGTKNVPVQLQSPNTTFIDISDPDTEQIITQLQIATYPRPDELFEKFVIPSLAALGDEELRNEYVVYVLQNYYKLSTKSKNDLREIKIVPVQYVPDRISSKRPIDTVAPDSVVSSLYFEDENRTPIKKFYKRYNSELHNLGVVEAITSEVVLDRITEYGKRGKRNYHLDEIAAKVEGLIKNCDAPPPLPTELIQSAQWVPAQDLAGTLGLFSPVQCRDKSRGALVKYIMPLVNFPVSPAWAQCLGWNQPLQKSQVLDQLQKAVNAKDNETLLCLVKSKELEACKNELVEMEWIPSSVDGYYSPSTIFFNDFRSLSPYFGTMEKNFKVSRLFKNLGVQDAPTLEQLRGLQDKLAEKGTLEDSDIKIAISILAEVAKRPPSRQYLSDFKAPDRHGRMHPISKLTSGDPGSAEVDLVILHPGVSLDIVKRLGIATFRDRYLELLNDPYFEGDFAQRESPIAVIHDTLQRYYISSTFSEYLANAEDSGNASKVCWILDAAENYSKENLLSQRLAEAQGPALFCYNDSVFTENDFRGITDIGVGSKGGSPSKIGKFGKGALTMYHWTSVPSFISGDYYVIFDPEQKYLPEHPRTKRPRAGMKLKIENIREQCPDQLQPFEGILGFNKDSKSFPGTLFRFPLQHSDSSAGKISIPDARKYLMDYYNEATNSLLFLKDISSISFREKHLGDPIWTVSSEISAAPNEPRIIQMQINLQPPIHSISDHANCYHWLIISSRNAEKIDIPKQLLDIKKKERLEAKYSIAILLEFPGESFYAQHFIGLPLGFVGKLGLPVHINADIIIGSNRKSIPIGENEDGSVWNRWIYEQGIAPMYLDLVTYTMNNGPTSYHYWPEYPSEALRQGKNSVTRTISAAFWELVKSSPAKLYPPVGIPSGLATSNPYTQKNLSLKAATFNFLDANISKFMLPLLLKLGVENIVSPSEAVQKGLKAVQLQSLSLITPTYFLNHLRSSPARYNHILLEFWANEKNYSIDFINSVLSFITSGDNELTSLVDCALLPLADNTLGTFFPKGGNESFLVATTPRERRILEISQGLMVHPNINPNVLRKLVSSGVLNITRLIFDDIKRLRPILESKSVEDSKDWLIEVWDYLKYYPVDLPVLQLAQLGNIPIYFGTVSGEPASKCIFFCPSDFDEYRYPVILEQSGLTKEALSILESFKGLILLDRSAFPPSMLQQESIKSAAGLYRLLRSIDILANKDGLFVESYINKIIPPNRITALRNLFPQALLSNLLRNYPSAKDYLLHFPIWPIESSPAFTHQPATRALLPPLAKLAQLGMAKGDVFIESRVVMEYSNELGCLGVKKMTLDNFLRNHVGICLGHEISADKTPSYLALLKILSEDSREAFSEYPIGVDGNGKFCMLNSLYAFDQQIFAAAFRNLIKSRFLHPDYRGLGIWRGSPLQSTITEDRYLACATSIQQRGAENRDLDDAITVFRYLCRDTSERDSWKSSTWKKLSAITFVPTQTSTSTIEHRVLRMQELARGAKLTTLIQGIHPDYTNIAWSQCPIFDTPPTQLVLNQTLTRGIPSRKIILDHLIFLSKNRFKVKKEQIPDYVKDVKVVYLYLLADSEVKIDTEEDIWLNIETEDIPSMSTDAFQESWTSPRNLLLKLQFDSLPFRRIRSFLAPFPELLKSSGVKEIEFPDIPDPPHSPKITDYSSFVLNGFQRLRSQGRAFDVTIIAQNQSFQAHWSFLAAVSTYWESMYESGMMEKGTRIFKTTDIAPKVLSVLLDYIYSGQVPNTDYGEDVTTELEELIDQLYTADLWQLDDLKTILERKLCNEHWIRPETVRRVLRCAQEVHAKVLSQVCIEYISNNVDVVQWDDDVESD